MLHNYVSILFPGHSGIAGKAGPAVDSEGRGGGKEGATGETERDSGS